MSDPFYGEIRPFAFNYAPYGWAYCNGATLQVNQFQALYAILGNHFGGTAPSTFGLPNLQGRAVIGADPATSPFTYATGAEGVSLNYNQCVAHTHALNSIAPPIGAQAKDAPASNRLAIGQWLAATSTAQKVFSDGPADQTHLDATTVGMAGSNSALPHENRQPYLTVNFCISTAGIWPYQN